MARPLRDSAAAFRGLPARLWLLCAVALVNRAGTMVVPFLTLYLVTERGYDTADVGLVGACFGIGAVAGSLLGGFASHRFGVAPVTLGSLLLGGAAFAVLPALGSAPAFAGGVLVASTLNDAFRPAIMTAVASTVEAGDRVRALALMRLALNLGMALGPALGGLVAALDYRWLFFGDALSCWLAAGALAWGLARWGTRLVRGSPAPAEDPSARPGPPPRRAALAVVMLACVAFAVVIFQFFTTVPVFLHAQLGWSEARVGQLLGMQALLIVALQMPLVHRLEARPPLRVAAVGALVCCAALGLLALPPGGAVAVGCAAAWGLGEMLSLPFLTTAVVSLAGSRPARAMGLYAAAFSSGWIVAPGIGLAVSERWGWTALWLGCTAAGLVIAALLLLVAASDRRAGLRPSPGPGPGPGAGRTGAG